MIDEMVRPALSTMAASSPARSARWTATGSSGVTFIIALMAILMVAATQPAAAADDTRNRAISDRFTIMLGTYVTAFETTASVGNGGILGTTINIEDDLGIDDDDSLLRIDGLYRFNPRHAIGFGYWNLDRDGKQFIDVEIDFGGDIFQTTGVIESVFDITWVQFSWRYSFLRNDRGEAGFLVGLSFYEFDIALEGLAFVNGMGPAVLARAEEDLIAPVPTIGMFINFSITPNVVVKMNASFLDLDIDDIEGKVIETNFAMEWYVARYFGLGLGFNGNDIDIRQTGDNPFTVRYDQRGLVAYMIFGWGDYK